MIRPVSSDADYAWEVATLFPVQGRRSEEAYLSLTDDTNRHIEFVDGRVEFLPMPTELHQELVGFLYRALFRFVEQRDLGKVQFSGLRVRIRPGNIREPDVLFLRKDHYHVRHNRAWEGADLVMEVVSGDPKDRQRHYEDKFVDYAAAKIAEYWIVDFERKIVIVHRLAGERYEIHGEFTPAERATSVLLPDFAIDVAELFAVADNVAE